MQIFYKKKKRLPTYCPFKYWRYIRKLDILYPLFLVEKGYINFVQKLVHLSLSVRLSMRVLVCSCVRFRVIGSSPKPSAAAALNFVAA